MKITPNPALIAGIAGRLGNVVLQPLRSRHIARRSWTIRAPATDAQTTHRQAVANAASLYQSVSPDVYPAWLLYAATLGYGPFAAWQHLNILPAKNLEPTCLTPPNAAYVPITNPAWSTHYRGQVCATWLYDGPAATHWVSTYYRPAASWSWTYDATVDAADESRIVSGLVPAATYELALVAHDAAKTTFNEAHHDFCDAGTISYQDFLTWTESDPRDEIEVQQHIAEAVNLTRQPNTWLCDDKGLDAFGTTWKHEFEWRWVSADTNCVGVIWAVAQTVQDLQAWHDDDVPALVLEIHRPTGDWQVNLINCWDGTCHILLGYSCPATYYVTVERIDSTHVEARTYTDPARTNLFRKHEIIIPADQLHRHVFAVNTLNTPNTLKTSFSVRDLNLHAAE